MNPVWVQILIVVGGNVTFFLLQICYFRWRTRENYPHELQKEIKQLNKDLTAVRGEVLYLKGRINGKEWRAMT